MACYYENTGTSNATATTVWYRWADASTSNTSGTWACWVDCGGIEVTCNTSAAASTTWRTWSTATTTRVTVAPALSAEEQANRAEEAERRAAEWKKRAEEEKQAREAAEKRAAELLERHLDDEQRKQFRERKPIRVMGGDGAAFELGYSWSGNVRELDKDGKPVAKFCIHPNVPVPIPDLLLSQKLMLETDPATFRRIANRTEMPAAAH